MKREEIAQWFLMGSIAALCVLVSVCEPAVAAVATVDSLCSSGLKPDKITQWKFAAVPQSTASFRDHGTLH